VTVCLRLRTSLTLVSKRRKDTEGERLKKGEIEAEKEREFRA
jgi:hypothetical protein